MEITKEILFGQITKLMEGVSSAKTIQKREEYMQKFFEDLIKFQKDFKDRNKTGVSGQLTIHSIVTSNTIITFLELITLSSHQNDFIHRRARTVLQHAD